MEPIQSLPSLLETERPRRRTQLPACYEDLVLQRRRTQHESEVESFEPYTRSEEGEFEAPEA